MIAGIPHRQELMAATLHALATLGGSGSIEEIREEVISLLKISDDAANVAYVTKSGNVDGRTELEYNLAWARTYLKQMGYVDNSVRGVWSLTAEGRHPKALKNLSVRERATAPVKELEVDVLASDWRGDLIKLLRQDLSPAAFERLVQRILRETGFVQVEVTGRTGDGGIDGKGIAKINGMLSFYVLFQCKRYSKGVSSTEIRNFRGAIDGRGDKGLFITTGYFTQEALREATRDGARAIDLMDGEKLVEKLKTLRLGVKVEHTESVSIDPEWFNNI